MNQQNKRYELLSPDQLIPTEEIDCVSAIALEQRILRMGKWTTAVAVHVDAYFVMDGHHRLTVAKRLGLRALPVVLLDYDDVEVTAWRDGESVTAEDVCRMAREGGRFPPKTTRHIFKHPIPDCDIPLDYLMQCVSPLKTIKNDLSINQKI